MCIDMYDLINAKRKTIIINKQTNKKKIMIFSVDRNRHSIERLFLNLFIQRSEKYMISLQIHFKKMGFNLVCNEHLSKRKNNNNNNLKQSVKYRIDNSPTHKYIFSTIIFLS